jgi:putative iron-dependent peroxidase
MSNPQAGIFALGTASHAYLEFDLSKGRDGHDLVAAVSSLREPRTTMGGVNLVAGFRPELWTQVTPDDAPAAVVGFNRDLSERMDSSCPPPSTIPCSGYRVARTTSSSTWPAR